MHDAGKLWKYQIVQKSCQEKRTSFQMTMKQVTSLEGKCSRG